LIILTLTSYSDKYPEPIWYEIEFGDGVTHLWSREIMYDYNGIVQETSDIVSDKYNNYEDEKHKIKNKDIIKDRKFINYQTSYNMIKESKEMIEHKMDSILQSIN
jgi:hypothetical protein